MEIERFKDELAAACRDFEVSRLAVFGSVARGDDGPQSDVDLLVRFAKPVGLTRLIKLEDRLAQILGRPVDLGTENSLHPLIKSNVLKESKLIYES